MGILGKLFGSNDQAEKVEKEVFPWIGLTDLKQLDQLELESENHTIAILKHSTRCGISRMVLRNFEKEYDVADGEAVKFYFLDLIANRDISNEIAERYNVRHESPQLIILKNKEVVHHTSHQGISAEGLKTIVLKG